MATNRFRRVMYDPSTEIPTYVPQDFVPDLSGVDNVLGAYQYMADKMYDFPVPKHLPQDKQDLDKEYISPIKALREKAVNSFSSGSSLEGLRAMRELDRFVVEAQKPGGVYHGFETRYSTGQERLKAIDKMVTEKERQDMAPYLQTRIGFRPFRSSDGNIQDLGAADYNMVLKAGEFDEWINKQLPFIKETLMSSGLGNKYRLDEYTDLYEMRQDMGVDFNKVMDVLASRMPSEYADAFRQEYQAQRMYDPTLPELSNETDPAGIFEYDEQGNRKKDKYGNYIIAGTPVGRVLQGAAYGYQHLDRKSQYIKDEDAVGVEVAKKKALDELERQEMTARTAVYDTGIEIPKVNFDGKGNVVITPRGFQAGAARASGGAVTWKSGEKVDAISYFNSSDFEQANPIGANVWKKIQGKAQAEKWTSEKATQEFDKLYKQVEEQMKTDYFTYDPEVNVTKIENTNAVFVGQQEGVGQIKNSTIYIMAPGEKPKAISYDSFLEDYVLSKSLGSNKKQGFVNKSMKYLGEIKAGQNTLPEGKMFSYVDPDGKTYSVIATDMPLEDVKEKMPLYMASEPAFNPSKTESDIVRMNYNVPATLKDTPLGKTLQTLSEGVYTAPQQRWMSDELREEQYYWEEVERKQGSPLVGRQKEEYDRVTKTLESIEENPQTDIFRGSQSVIFDLKGNALMVEDEMSTPDRPRMRQMTNKDLIRFDNALRQR